MHRFFEYAFILSGFIFLSNGCIEAHTPYLDQINASWTETHRVLTQKEKTDKDRLYLKKDSAVSRDTRKKGPNPSSLPNSRPGKKLESAKNLKSNPSPNKDKKAKSDLKSTKKQDADKENNQTAIGRNQVKKTDSPKLKSRKESSDPLAELSLSPM